MVADTPGVDAGDDRPVDRVSTQPCRSYFLRWLMGYRRDRQRADLMRAAGARWHGPAGLSCTVPSGGAQEGRAPSGQPFRVPGSGGGWVRAAGAGAGGGRVGGVAFFQLLLPYLVGRARGTSAAALGPRPTLVSFLSSVPAFLGRRDRSVGRVSVLVSELGRPLDDEPTGRPGWVGILLSPYHVCTDLLAAAAPRSAFTEGKSLIG
jgi:hypothetical protein